MTSSMRSEGMGQVAKFGRKEVSARQRIARRYPDGLSALYRLPTATIPAMQEFLEKLEELSRYHSGRWRQEFFKLIDGNNCRCIRAVPGERKVLQHLQQILSRFVSYRH